MRYAYTWLINYLINVRPTSKRSNTNNQFHSVNLKGRLSNSVNWKLLSRNLSLLHMLSFKINIESINIEFSVRMCRQYLYRINLSLTWTVATRWFGKFSATTAVYSVCLKIGSSSGRSKTLTVTEAVAKRGSGAPSLAVTVNWYSWKGTMQF